MKRIINLSMLIILVLGALSLATPAAASMPQHYTILVGSDNPSLGVSIMSYFPNVVRVHVGDTVTWVVKSHEIHTVTFLAGQEMPEMIIPAPDGMESPLQINPLAFFTYAPPNGQYDGTTYVNSSIMSTDPGFVTKFSLTFTHVGSFDFVCLVHGMMMSGTIKVVGPNTQIPSPSDVQTQAQTQLKGAWSKVPGILAKAHAQVVPPVKNQDGTYTRTIVMDYESGNFMVMGFFPKNTNARPGDTIVWQLSATDTAPHTVTFYNGNPDQPLVIIAQGQNGPVALVNPALLFPSQAVIDGIPLNNTDFFNSGFLMPGAQTSFSLKVGDVSGTLDFQCALHDTSGMTGSLIISSQ